MPDGIDTLLYNLFDSRFIGWSIFCGTRSRFPGNVATMMGYYSILNRIISEFNGLIRKLPILDNVAQRLTYFYEDAEPCGGGETLRKIHELHGEKFTFCYADKTVFAPCSFTINDGEKVVVYGQNGSGKSTILNVFLGILRDYSGNLTIDGVEFSAVNPGSYRDLVAYAPQDHTCSKVQSLIISSLQAPIRMKQRRDNYCGSMEFPI